MRFIIYAIAGPLISERFSVMKSPSRHDALHASCFLKSSWKLLQVSESVEKVPNSIHLVKKHFFPQKKGIFKTCMYRGSGVNFMLSVWLSLQVCYSDTRFRSRRAREWHRSTNQDTCILKESPFPGRGRCAKAGMCRCWPPWTGPNCNQIQIADNASSSSLCNCPEGQYGSKCDFPKCDMQETCSGKKLETGP